MAERPDAQTVVQRSMAGAVASLLANDSAVRQGFDAEGVHQMRVAIRNLRSQLRMFAPLVNGAPTALVDDLRWMSGMLGHVRDLDVLREVLDDVLSDLEPAERRRLRFLLTEIGRERSQRQAALGAAMSTDRYLGLLDRLAVLTESLRFTHRAERDAAEVLRPIARHAFRQLRKAARRARVADAPVEAVHRVRIRAKQFRCVLDSAAAVLPAATRQGKALARLQRVLGSFNDAVNVGEWLHHRAATEMDPARSLLLHGLAADLGRQADLHRSHWHRAWKRVRSPRRSAWLRG